jgi:streptomycin 6-kinase
VDAAAALDVFVGLLPRLWKPAGEPFTTLAAEAARWCANLPQEWEQAGRPFERRLLDAAVETLRDLAGSQGEPVLLHQDLHADNVLRAQREPWLAIDPKPLLGEREFGIAPIVRSGEMGHSRADVRYRFDRLTAELNLDRERARGWVFGQTLAWAFDDDGAAMPGHLDVARWMS